LFAGTANEVIVQPWIPQAGSGTRKDFVGKVSPAVTDDNAWQGLGQTFSDGTLPSFTAGKCIAVGQEHDASNAAFNSDSQVAAVMPMSASRWIAMKNDGSFDRSNGAVLGAVATATTLGVALNGTAAPANAKAFSPVSFDNSKQYLKYTANSSYYADTTWGRDVYLFVARARIYRQADIPVATGITSSYNAALAALVLGANVTNKLSNQDAAYDSNVGAVKAAFGFASAIDTSITFFKPYN
jgi:hypothetical protein